MAFSYSGKLPHGSGIADNRDVHVEGFASLVEAILAEAAELRAADRTKLAARILELGGYESAEGLARDNVRALLALRIAARLSSAD